MKDFKFGDNIVIDGEKAVFIVYLQHSISGKAFPKPKMRVVFESSCWKMSTINIPEIV